MITESHKTWLRGPGARLAQAFIGLLFFVTGLLGIIDGASGMGGMLGNLGVPAPEIMGWVVLVFKLLAGGALIVNKFVDIAAASLIGFTVIASLLAHLDYQDTGLWKNVAIIGGLMYVIANSGAGSVTRTEKSADPMTTEKPGM